MVEALLYQKLEEKNVKCNACAHRCRIPNGKRGICHVRENQNGKLYSLAYGKAVALNIDPIEKKPFFHFLPGTSSLSVATVGCNFRCMNCQNWDISQKSKFSKEIDGENLPPERIVEMAEKNKIPSISYTYTEPTVFLEYAMDSMILAKKKGIKNCWVSNGYFTEETLDLIAPYLDAANIDLKGFSEEFYQKYCGATLQPVLESLINLKKKKIWVEVTTLIIPSLNDSENILKEIAKFIKNQLGPETPWHLSRFSGAISWQLQYLPDTPAETIKKAWEIGKKEGLKYVYSGNIPGDPTEDTYCPKCKARVIERTGYSIKRYDKQGKCQRCEENLDLVLN